MYLGRIVAVGMSRDGRAVAGYRVSSRSFPNREIKVDGAKGSVIPKPGFENDIRKSPYIAYNCARIEGSVAVVSNGSHTDHIAEKIASGMNVRDALASVLLAMDYEKDAYSTPRIAGTIDASSGKAFLGIVRKNALIVDEVPVSKGGLFYVSTYECDKVSLEQFDGAFESADPSDACSHLMGKSVFADFANPVGAIAIFSKKEGGFELASLNS